MSTPLGFENLIAYSLQVALIAAVGLLLPRALRLRRPRVLYSYWQAVLAVCLLLPFVQPWRHFEVARSSSAASRILFDSAGSASRLAGLSPARLILLVLAGGAVLRLLWLALGLVQLRRYRRTSLRLEFLPPGIQETATRLSVAPEFCLNAEIRSPVTFGLRRPFILLPPHFAEMDADRQRAIASHELLHIVRRDWAFNLAEEVILAAFWFHPAIWWLIGRIRLSREQVVDRQVVDLVGAQKPYLYALVEIAAGGGASRAMMAPAFLNECQLAERIRALVKEELMSNRKIVISLACVALLTLLAGLVIIRKFPLKSGGAPSAQLNSMKADGAPLPGLNRIQAAPGVFAVGNGVSAPVPVFKPEPPYTDAARHAKLQGTVVLWVIIGADGAVEDATITKSLDPGLDQNAINTIKTWKFKPAMKAGSPVPCRVMVEVSFKMF